MDKNDFFAERGPMPNEDMLPAELLDIVHRYKMQPVPRPDYKDTSRLLKILLSEETVAAVAHPQPVAVFSSTLRIVRVRLQLLGFQFWIVNVCTLFLCTILAVFMQRERAVSLFMFYFPLMTISGVIHALRRDSRGLREVEEACPTSFLVVTVGCVLTIISFNCLLDLLATIGIAFVNWASFGAMLMAWLGPTLLLTGLAVPISLRWGTLPAIVIGVGPWLLLTGFALIDTFPGKFSLLNLLPHDQPGEFAYLLATVSGILILLSLVLQRAKWQRVLLPEAIV